MMNGEFSVISQAASSATAMTNRHLTGTRRSRSQVTKKKTKPWMMCENVYQSVNCCEFSALCTTPCHSLTVPHLQIGTRPIASRTAACSISSAMATKVAGGRYGLTAPVATIRP